jgi:hypothetical protein
LLVVSLGCPKIPPKISSAIYACYRYDDRALVLSTEAGCKLLEYADPKGKYVDETRTYEKYLEDPDAAGILLAFVTNDAELQIAVTLKEVSEPDDARAVCTEEFEDRLEDCGFLTAPVTGRRWKHDPKKWVKAVEDVLGASR